MKNNSVYKDALKAGIFIFALGIIEFILFTVFMSFRMDILIGVLYGCTFTTFNFFYLAFCVKKAVEKEEKMAKAYMASTYTTRMILIGLMVVVAANVEWIHLWAAVIPLAFQRIVATVIPIIEERRKNRWK